MSTVRKSRRGIDYLPTLLKTKKTVVTRAILQRIPHKTQRDDLALKLGRYVRVGHGKEEPQCGSPKSELTLDDEELRALIAYLEENHAPFQSGARRWVALDKDVGERQAEQLKAIFGNPDKKRLLDFLAEHEIVPDDLIRGLEYQSRLRTVERLEAMLENDLLESDWQAFFEQNDWILGSDYVCVIGERAIDTSHIADYLMKAYDGFLDVVEIKRPEGDLRFWADGLDHGNYVPHSDLIKAITQANRYLLEVEREANSVKFLERLNGVRAIKPRCVLVFGRSSNWDDAQREAYRILNASYHDLTILTYDHVVERAKRILGVATPDPAADADTQPGSEPASVGNGDDIPF